MKPGDRCELCGSIIGEGGLKGGQKKHGWNLPEGGTVACHEASEEQRLARRAAVDAQLKIEKDKHGHVTNR